MKVSSPPASSVVVAVSVLLLMAIESFGVRLLAHDITTHVTWNREVSRIVYERCASCHQPAGAAFSLLTYDDATSWARAIKDDVLSRRMPPWGAVKGFGTFANESALTPEQIDLVTAWVNGGLPEGNPNDLPTHVTEVPDLALPSRADDLVVADAYRFSEPFTVAGFSVTGVAPTASAQVTLHTPDGAVRPLVWLHGYTSGAAHPFILRQPLPIAAGTYVRGLPAGATLRLSGGRH